MAGYGENDALADEPASGGYGANDTLADQKPAKSSAIRRGIGDTALSFGQGAIGAVKAITDTTGAGTAVSKTLGDIGQGMQGLLSPERQAEMVARQAKVDEADKSGKTLDQVTSRLGGFVEAPVQTLAQGIGSIVPTVAAAIATRGKTLPALGVGAAMGVGGVKGQNYDAVLNEATARGLPPAEAEALAQKAAEYSRENAGQQALGGALGALAGTTGVERIVSGAVGAGRGIAQRVARGAIGEGLPEGAQGAQQQYAQNKALNQAGFQTDPMAGVVGQGVFEGTVGSAIGGLAGVPRQGAIDAPPDATGQPAPAVQTAPDAPDAAPTPGDAIRAAAPEVIGPLTGGVAAMAESQAKAVDAAVPPLPAGQAKELTGLEAAVARQNIETPGRISAEDALGGFALDPGVDSRELSLEEANAAAGPAPGFRTPAQISADGMPPIPTGTATELPLETVEPTAAPDPKREPRTPKPQSTRGMTDADVVQAYVEQRRTEGTLAGRRFAGDFDAGRIKPEDVMALVRGRKEPTPDERLAAAASQAPKKRTDGLLDATGNAIAPTKDQPNADQPRTSGPAIVVAGASNRRAPTAGNGREAVGPLPASTGGLQSATGEPVAGGADSGPDRVGAKPDGALSLLQQRQAAAKNQANEQEIPAASNVVDLQGEKQIRELSKAIAKAERDEVLFNLSEIRTYRQTGSLSDADAQKAIDALRGVVEGGDFDDAMEIVDPILGAAGKKHVERLESAANDASGEANDAKPKTLKARREAAKAPDAPINPPQTPPREAPTQRAGAAEAAAPTAVPGSASAGVEAAGVDAEAGDQNAVAEKTGRDVMPAGLNVTFGGKTYPVESITDAQEKWIRFQESADGGAPAGVSQVGNGVPITDGAGRLVARVAYNGRVFGPNDELLAEAPKNAVAPDEKAPPQGRVPEVAAPVEEDPFAVLFGTPAEQAESQRRFLASQESERQAKQAEQAHVERVRSAIVAEKKRATAEHDEWAGKVYKSNRTQVELRGDGPSNQASMSIGAINESRRRNAMEALTQELRALDRLDAALKEDSAKVMSNLRDLMQKAGPAVASGNWPGMTADSMFESMLLDQLKFRGPGGKGNVTSNGLSKAVLAAMKSGAAPAAEPAPTTIRERREKKAAPAPEQAPAPEPERNEKLVALRKQLSVLKSIRKCLG